MREHGARLGFGARLFLAILITLAAVGLAGYFVMADQLKRSQIASNATAHRADARTLEATGRGVGRPALAL